MDTEITRPGRATLYRRHGGKVLYGVAGGLADHLGVDVFRVRAVFVVLTALAGAGAVAYALLAFFTPAGTDTVRSAPAERRQAYGLILVGLVALGLSFAVAANAPAQQLIAAIFVLGGTALVWREVDVTGLGGGSARSVTTWLRLLIGAVLVIGGLTVMVLAGGSVFAGINTTVLAVLATLVGVVVLTVPLWMRLLRALDAERAARIRNDEREEIASHLHDSVLQTLALIQKQSGDPDTVARLARRQERELRAWLFGDPAQRRESFAAAIAALAAEVEQSYDIEFETVTVGDIGPDELRDAQWARAASSLLAATREAMVNAAKHSGVQTVDVYAEVSDEAVEVFVRDRGCGFEPEAVDDDRQGITGSIRGRMERAGGRAAIASAPGRGTNVTLTLPRTFGAVRADDEDTQGVGHGARTGSEEPA
ncbi:putative two-component histidine kinase [Gordonia hirsuta DSM 44140 = NBRC 16056]|uniref:Putative two-component histidine kinase n=1 Tax=Gordonia hirsuta DSM 44140 = NBRC 16056 TaxID=1121927 RepID=L7L6V2_9ACTN|nr:ATP-binding protein [Gordonia hirsuta]GAC56654.1 putative two-component histidine kinase [Gordonia hirsuta DSM 44140 = NBRC 16056]